MPFKKMAFHKRRLSTMGIGKIDDLVSTEQLKESIQNLEIQLANIRKQNSKLLSEIQNTKGNVLVYIRIRPEISPNDPNNLLDVYNDNALGLSDPTHTDNKPYSFDHCFPMDSTQQMVYEEFEHLAVSVIDGYQVAVIAYGQTGSGKTYTMIGEKNNSGLFFNITSKIIELSGDEEECTIKISMYEIYNEEVFDLLSDKRVKMTLKSSDEGITADGITEKYVKTNEDVLKFYKVGSDNRSTASTNMNDYSSRSHCILLLTVQHKVNKKVIVGRINLVDLAGSERVDKSGAEGARLVEAQNINKSLSCLGDVIAALDTKSKHIPYRNSKLTYALKDALSPGAKTIMICTARNDSKFYNETVCTLNFATRIRKINLGNAKKMVEYKSFEDENDKLKDELSKLKKEFNKLQKQNTSLMNSNKEELEKISNNKEKSEKQFKVQIKELTSTIEQNNALVKDLKSELNTTKSKLEKTLSDLNDVNTKLTQSEQKISDLSKTKTETSKLQNELNNLQSEKDALEKQIAVYQKNSVNEKKSTDEQNKKLMKQMASNTEQLKSEIEYYNKELKELKTTNRQLKQENDKLTKENTDIQKKLTTITSKYEEAVKDRERYLKDYASAQDQISKLKGAVKAATKNPVKVHNSIATRRATMTNSTTSLPAKTKTYKRKSALKEEITPETSSLDDSVIKEANGEVPKSEDNEYIDFDDLGIPITDFNEDVYNYYFEVVEADENNEPVEY